MMVIDGLAGSPLAAKNTATVAAWVHYRGLIVVALLLAGNLFCAGCPFLLSRKLARWIGSPHRRWPRALRNKWLAIGALLGMLFAYELFDLWASPWLTAWVIIGYFVAAFVLGGVVHARQFLSLCLPAGHVQLSVQHGQPDADHRAAARRSVATAWARSASTGRTIRAAC